MIAKALRSRGARKFRRNRLAMASLAVIAAYLLLAGWIVATNAVNQYAVSLEERPVLGLLLVSKTRENYGPREMPGFGMAGDARQRYEAAQFYLDIASNAFRAIDRLEPGSARDPREILGDYDITGRPFADLPVEDLRGIYALADAQARRVLDVRVQIGALGTTRVLADRLGGYAAQLRSLVAAGRGDTDEALNRQEDIAFALEEMADGIEAYQATAQVDNAVTALDTTPLRDAADAILDGRPVEGDQYDRGMIEAVDLAVRDVEGGLRALMAREVDALTPLIEELFPPPTGIASVMNDVRMLLGTDRQGRSILIRALYSSKVAIQVGVIVALIAVGVGALLGAAAAFFGGWVDHGVNWLYSMFTSIPYLVLLAVLAMLFIGSKVEGTLVPLYVAFSLTYWIGPCRVIRGETMKIKELEYVQAATAIGFGRGYILLRHVIPNTSHLMFINFSLLLIAAIKGEVILTFLGLGLREGASWGIMIRDSAQQVVNDNFWQMGAATFFMFALVLAFNIFTDALQDAFDPRHVG